MAKIPYFRPRGSIHDLDAVLALGDARTHLLCVSDRTLYLLGNLAALDIAMSARWQEERLEDGYIPVSRDSARYDLFLEAVNNFQLEVLPVDCDIVAALGGIRDAIQAIQETQASQYAAQQAAGLVCCNYTMDPADYYNPDGIEGDPESKCALAYSYALIWSKGVKEIYHQWAAGAFPALGVLAAILDELGLPGQTLLEIVSLGASNALPVLEEVFNANVDTLIPNVTCAVYSSTNATSAKTAIYTEIDSLEGVNPVVAEMLKAPVATSTLNKVFDATLPITTDPIPNCQVTCDEQQGDLFQTALVYPFNRLILGTSIEFDAQDATQGYRGQNSGQVVDLYFSLDGPVSDWHFEAEVFPTAANPAQAQMIIQSFGGGQWNNLSAQYSWPGTPGQAWTRIEVDAPDNLPAAAPLRVHLNLQDFNEFMWFRKVLGYSL